MRTKMKTKWPGRLVLAGCLAATLSLSAQPVGRWDFNGNLNPTDSIGSDMTIVGGAVVSYPVAGTAGVPALPVGTEAVQPQVMQFPKATAGQGVVMPIPDVPNGTAFAIDINNWTLIMDVAYPAASSDLPRSLIDYKTPQEAAGSVNGPEVSINTSNQLVVGDGAGDGTISADTWLRVVVTSSYVGDDLSGQAVITRYIDGFQVGSPIVGSTIGPDGYWALKAGETAKLFADNNSTNNIRSETGYVSSIQLRDVTLSAGQVSALKGATTDKIPAVIPPIPTILLTEETLPAVPFGRPEQIIRYVIQVGTQPQDADVTGITLTVDGTDVISNGVIVDSAASVDTIHPEFVVVTYDPDPDFALQSDHAVQLTYTDSIDGVRSSSVNEFRIPLNFEGFEGVTLKEKVDEPLGNNPGFTGPAWTHTPPQNWEVTSVPDPENGFDGVPGYTGIPNANDGVTEWAGWSFASFEFWTAADGQQRADFTKAFGNIAVADPDEWDDQNHDAGTYNTIMDWQDIDISSAPSGESLFIQFDSSWRDEDDQKVRVEYRFDDGEFMELFRWTSDSADPDFKDDAVNETLSLPLDRPEGAQSLNLRFVMFDAGNDWWWAIDNVVVDSGPIPITLAANPSLKVGTEGGTASFSVAVESSSSEPISYQWFRGTGENRVAVENQTEATLQLGGLTFGDAEFYSVDVTNPAGTVTSSFAPLIVVPSAPASGDIAGQWDFDSADLSATTGGDITYLDGPSGTTATGTEFGTTTALGIPNIGGVEADVMKTTPAEGFAGYIVPIEGSNGGPGATELNQYTLAFDILYPAASDASWRSLAQIDELDNSGDGDFFVRPSNAVGIGDTGYYGAINADTWHRVVIIVDQSPEVNTVSYYIDGTFVGAGAGKGLDGRFGIYKAINFFSDNGDETEIAYVNSIQVRNRAISKLEAIALGGASAAGIPQSIDTTGVAPVIAVQPIYNTTITAGQSFMLSVDVQTGTAATYQWFKDGIAIAGATSESFSIENVFSDEAGEYTVTITNGAGETTSAVALVKVPDITDDLVVHLTFDADLNDASGRNNNASTGAGTTPLEAGLIGNAVNVSTTVEGGRNYVTLGAPADLNFGTVTDFSVAFWVKSPERKSDPALIANKDWGSGSNPGWGLFVNGEKLQMNMAPARNDYDPSGGEPEIINDGWHHVVGVFDRDGMFDAYVDGSWIGSSSIASSNGNLDTPEGQATNIGEDGTGEYNDDGDGSPGFAQGTLIDDVGIWRRTLTGPEVSSIYRQGLAGENLQSATGETLGDVTFGAGATQGTLEFNWRGQPGAKLQKSTDNLQTWQDVPGADGVETITIPFNPNANEFFRLLKQNQ